MRPNFEYLAQKYASERNNVADPFLKGRLQAKMEDAFIAGVRAYQEYLIKNHKQVL